MRGKYKRKIEELDERISRIETYIGNTLESLRSLKRKTKRPQRPQRSKEDEELLQRVNSLWAYLENRFRPEIEKEQQKSKSEKDTGQQVK